MKRKGQSALEYLVSYGWWVFAVILIAAILYAFGFNNPSASVKELVLNSTPDFKSCDVTLANDEFVCLQSNGYLIKVSCLQLSGDWYCSGNPLVKMNSTNAA